MNFELLQEKYPIGSIVELKDPQHSRMLDHYRNRRGSIHEVALDRHVVVEGHQDYNGDQTTGIHTVANLPHTSILNINVKENRLGVIVWYFTGGCFLIPPSYIRKVITPAA